MLVTTSYHPDAELEAKAQRLAAEYGGRPAPRRRDSLQKLMRSYGDPAVLLVAKGEIRYYEEDQDAMFFHPSMSQIRVKRLLGGEPDALVEACGALPGDHVLDCTAGLASDAIVLSCAVGASGSVTALESEPVPAMLIREGLAAYEADLPQMTEAMRRISVRHAHHLDVLRELPGASVDIVYFDPMFRRPIRESSSIAPLRTHANIAALTPEAVEQARRVARKRIVLKEQRTSGEFARLGFDSVLRSNTKTTYGVIQLC
ncbi:class I SAM-dependent methyltransferase [Paenibacillus athensensis]|uniref:SAM-dependent methyltransferase n=1 Tax=Paenibacillus athensensis TaxID=1967502 RepID=A0A4Y8Q8H5_9BACL|nr:class I SAM-dependent methyltransferase [Paenibacillus athensensis]MCD1257347.1 class I SAM-dependent methyltransferase [Paenibacillus athensensis]